jgi:hypothetical protein
VQIPSELGGVVQHTNQEYVSPSVTHNELRHAAVETVPNLNLTLPLASLSMAAHTLGSLFLATFFLYLRA